MDEIYTLFLSFGIPLLTVLILFSPLLFLYWCYKQVIYLVRGKAEIMRHTYRINDAGQLVELCITLANTKHFNVNKGFIKRLETFIREEQSWT